MKTLEERVADELKLTMTKVGIVVKIGTLTGMDEADMGRVCDETVALSAKSIIEMVYEEAANTPAVKLN